MKQVFYDGLRCLPWYKPWIIIGLQYLSQYAGVKREEMQQIYDVLSERELRIRSDSLEGWA